MMMLQYNAVFVNTSHDEEIEANYLASIDYIIDIDNRVKPR